MHRHLLGSCVIGLLATACAASPPPPSEGAPPPAVAVTAPPATPASAPAIAPEPTAEDKAKAEAQKKLAADRAELQKKHEAAVARWTPEMKAEAKALASKTFPSGRAAIEAAAKAKFRDPENAARDGARHPAKTLEFFGFKPTMTVLEYGPGAGWYTELLAPALAAKGKLLVTMMDPSGPKEARGTYYGEVTKLFLATSPELYGKVEPVVLHDGKPPALGLEGLSGAGTVDLAFVVRGMHGMVNSGHLDAWLGEIHKALKPNGVLGVVQHRAKPDAKAEESSKNGYLPQAWVIEKVEAAGFKLAAKSELNANTKDTTDHPKGVWTLPPTLRLGEEDKAKYVAIGESDRMTLKFVKVAKKVPAGETGAAAAPKKADPKKADPKKAPAKK
jgi:predicted methyltransferase